MLEKLIFGNLTLQAIPYQNPIIMGAGVFMGLVIAAIVGAVFYFKKWKWLWSEWITTVDHKKIGIMYIILAIVMLLRGLTDALMMRLQQVMAVGDSMGYLPPEHYNQIFTAHGVIMIFFMAMPFMFGLINLVLPLQIGARDVAFPFLNSLSFWLAVVGAMLVNISLIVGDFAATGWLAYPPLSELAYSPTVGVDYYIWALQISGIGTLLSGINFVVTIFKMRCPGMTLMKMPIFTWTALCSMILVILAFPVLTVTLGMLFLDRYFGMHFFTADFGGNAMMYINMIWIWGHPEVYILILPAFGIYSEVVATFSKKYLFGYATMVWATACITILAFSVWLHHFFTMGAGSNVNAFFGIATMIISVPTGVKVFNWLFTMYRGRITFTTPMLWTIGFITTFVVGGMTGVLMAVPAVDYQVHNSLFLIAHFHNAIIGGVVFGYLAGLTYWFPKAFGFKLNETLGKYAFWCWIIGFYIAFMPLYLLGLMGMTRRLSHYDASTGWQPYLIVAGIGALIIVCGVVFQVLQLVVSIKNREQYKDLTGDPWDGRTLEWSIPSPAPFYNFATTPVVNSRDAFWEAKRQGLNQGAANPSYHDIHMPKNTGTGFIIAMCCGVFGFAIIWHITWLTIAGLVGAIVTMIMRSFSMDTDYYLKAAEVERLETQKA
ncbi:cytochrome o ubiquinol oxidase subunit I [Aquicella lusitana]|uniref:Cytochrome bo(3) ubiquinol oxidase subunit 1 n=1 Tax=Aquicella lusitana TaxID=254246 RepID=A0A370GJ59_9COXI|nr:cytochrome o ubiquinol oxidase subunit I [Aquicella lusitana]RDI43400.1 cytochrome bo3 quinol oxidase subunit 1 apoprotein [Aquicella lusitana]VVC73550.1 Cytochrome bo(3) ubiquinol oxidase subunit 1 [Aquicella lusitana]